MPSKRAKSSGQSQLLTPPIKIAEAKKAKRKSFWLSFLSKVALFYIVFAALWHCPSRPFAFDYSTSDGRPVCKNIALAHQQIAPIVKPYLLFASQQVEPYTKPVFDVVSPHVTRAHKLSRPICLKAAKECRFIYRKHVNPVRKLVIQSAKSRLDPYRIQAYAHYGLHVRPHVDTVQRVAQPYCDIYRRDVAPYIQKAYKYSLDCSWVTFTFYKDQVHPNIVQLIKRSYSIVVNHAFPVIRRSHNLYIQPQLNKALDKVYEKKTLWLGSTAIKASQSKSKQVAKQSTKQAQQTQVAKQPIEQVQQTQAAKQSTEQVQQTQVAKQPTEQVQQTPATATMSQPDPIPVDQGDETTGNSEVEADQETEAAKIARLDVELEAEEETVKEQLELWESGMTKLIRDEYIAAIKRLIELRNRQLANLPDRFGLLNEAFVEDQVAVILSRIQRGFKKLSAATDQATADERITTAKAMIEQLLGKLEDAVKSNKAQVAQFYQELLSQETQVIETSFKEISRYAATTKQAYDQIMNDCKFSLTLDEWTGWDKGVKKRAGLYLEELLAVQQGDRKVDQGIVASDLSVDAPNLNVEIASLRPYSEKLYTFARKEVVDFANTGLNQLDGDGVLAAISDVTEEIADHANRISIEAASELLAAVSAARAKLRIQDAGDDSGYFARAKAYVQRRQADNVVADDQEYTTSVAEEQREDNDERLDEEKLPVSIETIESTTAQASIDESFASTSTSSASDDGIVDAQSFVLSSDQATSVYDAAISEAVSAYSGIIPSVTEISSSSNINPTEIAKHASSMAVKASSILHESVVPSSIPQQQQVEIETHLKDEL